ncbi:hypothetical protein GCM10010298_36500 [Streptomyces microflavus]|uniref:Uncharacterized protein n=1 Tax=Streptomyces microflavus TaxID=1919 RepID=A0A7J0D5R3_STRMI|nr:hypothetical protein Smic_79430 [Streptomyces microflavus]GGX68229.1 hypothetical protein GCM10010298_36500 [Streptomyces microflavus]
MIVRARIDGAGGEITGWVESQRSCHEQEHPHAITGGAVHSGQQRDDHGKAHEDEAGPVRRTSLATREADGSAALCCMSAVKSSAARARTPARSEVVMESYSSAV